MNEKIEKTLNLLPLKPGVYIMKNSAGEIIYVGKSRSLKKRVNSYFNRIHDNAKTNALVAAADQIEYIVTTTEIEALILENNLIKRHKPRYNILLKDSKTHPYIRLTTSEAFPKLEKVRKVHFKDKNRYFGPFPNGIDLIRIVDLLSRSYRLCTAKKVVKPLPSPDSHKPRPCLRFHLGLCSGACQGEITPEEYAVSVKKVDDVLSGRTPVDFSSLERQLKEMSAKYRFEEAAELRDTISALKRFFETQKVEFLTPVNLDFWGMSSLQDRLIFSVFAIRGGKLLGNRIIDVEREPEQGDREVLSAVMSRHYDDNLVPAAIYCSIEPDGAEALLEMLKERTGHKVDFHIPQKGQYHNLLTMANNNALEVLRTAQNSAKARLDDSVIDLQRRLNLNTPPVHIECVDISHIQGTDPVASLVVSHNGLLKKGEYRLFHIKTAKGGDDPASIAEVTRRRFTRLLEEDGNLPDLYIVDGGITQVHAALAELEKLDCSLTVMGLAKRDELLVQPDGSEIKLPFSSPGMRMIIKLRNEAHRFCNTFQNKTHTKRVMRSALLKLPGVGPVTLKKLILEFGSTANVAKLTPEQIVARCKMPLKTAELILESLKTESK
jgi:excinuclease ABC subunit C